MSDTAAVKPSPVTLLYIFADRLIPKAGLLNSAIVPGTDVKVQSQELLLELIACALWTLRQQGYVKLEDVEKKVLFMKHHEINVSLLKPVGDLAGLEGDFGRRVSHATELWTLLLATFGETNTPGFDLTRRMYEAAVKAGYLRHAGGGIGDKLHAMLSGSEKAERVPEAFAALEPEFAAFQTEWTAFKTSEAALYAALLARAKTGLHAIEPPDNTPG